jgi:hypothetical protein
MADQTKADWCPACGGALAAREISSKESDRGAAIEIDHRGIVLPRRNLVGGIITPV